MNRTEYWRLIDTLGGVANTATVAELEQRLLAEDLADDFADVTEQLITELDSTVEVAGEPDEDATEQALAAVIAAGRERYEATLAAGSLDPSGLATDEADALLVIGLALPEADGAGEYPIELIWSAGTGAEPGGEELHEDQAWADLWAQYGDNTELQEVMESIAPTTLQIDVADVEELTMLWSAEPDAVQPDVVRLRVPVGWIEEEESRTVAYLNAVNAFFSALSEDD